MSAKEEAMEDLAIHAAVLGVLGVIILCARSIFCTEEMQACPSCKGQVNFLTVSLYDKSKKVCPDCADREWENRPRRA